MVTQSNTGGCSIYILKLKGSKYYVGKTSNVEKRIRQHARGAGSSWTRKHPFEKLLRVFHNCDSYDEDKYTLKLIDRFGVENVRGGSYVSINLSQQEIESITRRIRMATDRCLKCGSPDHFSYRCRVKKKVKVECDICFEGHETEKCPHL